ncbi:hypothetical protein FZC76_04995 [Sutcliffiella horikoshii]|uniref:Uncharacterized protein n=1 Tax=Sutcliffiella horikoshii TaxID=79883 RepID=A0A5D4T4V1_9BACI|nr:hypothetical protein FZC76_04995 [Sutcliffiella horikoshii]
MSGYCDFFRRYCDFFEGDCNFSDDDCNFFRGYCNFFNFHVYKKPKRIQPSTWAFLIYCVMHARRLSI